MRNLISNNNKTYLLVWNLSVGAPVMVTNPRWLPCEDIVKQPLKGGRAQLILSKTKFITSWKIPLKYWGNVLGLKGSQGPWCWLCLGSCRRKTLCTCRLLCMLATVLHKCREQNCSQLGNYIWWGSWPRKELEVVLETHVVDKALIHRLSNLSPKEICRMLSEN